MFMCLFMSCLFVRLQKVHVHVDVCHYVFDFVHVSVHCLPFVWMFVIPFSQCSHCLLCMSMCMCLIMYSVCVCGCLSLFFSRRKSRKSVRLVNQDNEDLTWALNLARPDSSGATHASLHAQQACHHRQRALHEGSATSKRTPVR